MPVSPLSSVFIAPATRLSGVVTLPPSKSASIRAVLASALAAGESSIDNLADSENVRAIIQCVSQFGATTTHKNTQTFIGGVGLPRSTPRIVFNPGNSGIVLRLLLGAAAHLDAVTFETDFVESLGSRGNLEMLKALTGLGVKYSCSGQDGRLPIMMNGSKIHGGRVRLDSSRSSQFLSGLMFLGGLLDDPLEIQIDGKLTSKTMVQTTIDVLGLAGVVVDACDDLRTFRTTGKGGFQPAHYSIGSDPASTAAMIAVAAVVQSDVTLKGYDRDDCANQAVLTYVQAMGVNAQILSGDLRIMGGGDLRAHDFDGSLAPDAVLPLAAIAVHASGQSTFFNIEHLRYKECDRISDFRKELAAIGVKSTETRDSLTIEGSPKGIGGGAQVVSHFDHGVVMALTAIALRSEKGLSVIGWQHVRQTYRVFFEDLQTLGVVLLKS